MVGIPPIPNPNPVPGTIEIQDSQYQHVLGQWIPTGCTSASPMPIGVAVGPDDLRARVVNRTDGRRCIRLLLFADGEQILGAGVTCLEAGQSDFVNFNVGGDSRLSDFVKRHSTFLLATDHYGIYPHVGVCTIATTSLYPQIPAIPPINPGNPLANPIPSIPVTNVPNLLPGVIQPYVPGNPYNGAYILLNQPWDQIPQIQIQVNAGLLLGAPIFRTSKPGRANPTSLIIVYNIPQSGLTQSAWILALRQLAGAALVEVSPTDIPRNGPGLMVARSSYRTRALDSTANWAWKLQAMWDRLGASIHAVNIVGTRYLDGQGVNIRSPTQGLVSEPAYQPAVLFNSSNPDRSSHQMLMYYSTFGRQADMGFDGPFGFPYGFESIAEGDKILRSTNSLHQNDKYTNEDILHTLENLVLDDNRVKLATMIIEPNTNNPTPFNIADKIRAILNTKTRFVLPTGNPSNTFPDGSSTYADDGQFSYGQPFLKPFWDTPSIRRFGLVVGGSGESVLFPGFGIGKIANKTVSRRLVIQDTQDPAPLVVLGPGITVSTVAVDGDGNPHATVVNGSSLAAQFITTLLAIGSALNPQTNPYPEWSVCTLPACCPNARNNAWQPDLLDYNPYPGLSGNNAYWTRNGFGGPDCDLYIQEVKKTPIFLNGRLTIDNSFGPNIQCARITDGNFVRGDGGVQFGGSGTITGIDDSNVFVRTVQRTPSGNVSEVGYQRIDHFGSALLTTGWIDEARNGPIAAWKPAGNTVIARTNGWSRVWLDNVLYAWDGFSGKIVPHPNLTYVPFLGQRWLTGEPGTGAADNGFPAQRYGYYAADAF